MVHNIAREQHANELRMNVQSMHAFICDTPWMGTVFEHRVASHTHTHASYVCNATQYTNIAPPHRISYIHVAIQTFTHSIVYSHGIGVDVYSFRSNVVLAKGDTRCCLHAICTSRYSHVVHCAGPPCCAAHGQWLLAIWLMSAWSSLWVHRAAPWSRSSVGHRCVRVRARSVPQNASMLT